MFERITPGTWGVTYQYSDQGVSHMVFAPEPLVVAPGARIAQRIVLTPRRLTVVLRDADGNVVPPSQWSLFGTDDKVVDGHARVCDVPPGQPVTVRYANAIVATLDLEPGRETQTIEVRLPR